MKARNDEKKIDDDFTMLKKKETFLKNEPKTQEIDIKLEDQEIIEKNSNIEIYNFEIDKEFYKFKITTKGIEYIPKKKIETNRDCYCNGLYFRRTGTIVVFVLLINVI